MGALLSSSNCFFSKPMRRLVCDRRTAVCGPIGICCDVDRSDCFLFYFAGEDEWNRRPRNGRYDRPTERLTADQLR